MRKRMLSDEPYDSARFDGVSVHGRDLHAFLTVYADESGFFEGSRDYIRRKITAGLPTRQRRGYRLERYLEELLERGLVVEHSPIRFQVTRFTVANRFRRRSEDTGPDRAKPPELPHIVADGRQAARQALNGWKAR